MIARVSFQISGFIKSLEISLENAKDELEKRGKLYIKGSILAASAVVLLLI